MRISKWWQGEGLKDCFFEGQVVVRSHLSSLSVTEKGIESDEESSGVDTGAYSLLLVSLEAGRLSVDRDWIIFHASSGSMFDWARCL